MATIEIKRKKNSSESTENHQEIAIRERLNIREVSILEPYIFDAKLLNKKRHNYEEYSYYTGISCSISRIIEKLESLVERAEIDSSSFFLKSK